MKRALVLRFLILGLFFLHCTNISKVRLSLKELGCHWPLSTHKITIAYLLAESKKKNADALRSYCVRSFNLEHLRTEKKSLRKCNYLFANFCQFVTLFYLFKANGLFFFKFLLNYYKYEQ